MKREQWIAELEQEIDRLQRTEERRQTHPAR
jgi:hypothetical protein